MRSWLIGTGAGLTVAAAVAATAVAALPGAALAHPGDTPIAQGRALASDTQFYTPRPDHAAVQQIAELTANQHKGAADLLKSMVNTPQAVWFTKGTPEQVQHAVKQTVKQAEGQRTVPVLVAYNIPGRDCAQYSSGGAATDADYQAWISSFANGIGNGKAVVLLEPDALANLPSDCGANAYAGETTPPTDATRIADLAFAVHALEADPNTSVYLDGGHSAWQSVGNIAKPLVEAGVLHAQGFFLNVSNYQYTQNNVEYGTWVSDCIALGAGSTSYDYAGNCPNQYWNGGPANNWTGVAMSPYGVWSDTASNPALNTAGINSRYASMLGSTTPTAHFVIDTSRNGTGPNDMSSFGAAPYNQSADAVATLKAGNWCNPVGAGTGLTPTANTSAVSPLLDAYLWVKTPGQSDGQCDAAGGVRAWNYSAYTQSSWPTSGPNPATPATCGGSTAATCTFDPLWGTTDPAAGAWFPQEALQLAQDANPPLAPAHGGEATR